RRFYIRARQVRTGLAQTASIGRWANCKNTSRSGMSGVVSRWLGGVEQLDFIAERLLRVQIENRPAIDIIKLYDSKETLFYCDPPYIHETRGDTKSYRFEMNDNHHRELAKTLNSVDAFAAVSNYDCELMEELYSSKKWTKVFSPEKTIHSTKDMRQEVLWINYDVQKISKIYSLF
ncbi:MAG: DNA adenine methylase, partial [Ginsengibacter sp.]